MMQGSIMSTLNLTYSELIKSDIKYILEMSPVQYFAFGVEIIEFQWVLIVSIDAVCVLTLPS